MQETETKQQHQVPELEDLRNQGPIAVAGGRPPAEVWTPARIELIKKQICPAGITDDEFAVFLEKCRRSGLDPLMGECFCVPRGSNVKIRDPKGTIDKETGKVAIVTRYVEQHVFQAAEQGMEVRAHRSGDFIGIRAGAIYEGDHCAIDFAEGRVIHRTNAALPRGKLLGAWAIASRRGVEIQPVAHVLLAEYNQGQSVWVTKPETMIVKCARSAALRLAFPAEFAGIYTAAEMSSMLTDEAREATGAQAEKAINAPATAPGAASSKTDDLEELLKKRAGKTTVEAKPRDANQAITVNGKRKWIEDATTPELEAAVAAGVEAIGDPKLTPDQKARSEEKLVILHAEIKRRDDLLANAFGPETPAASSPDPAPTPGSGK